MGRTSEYSDDELAVMVDTYAAEHARADERARIAGEIEARGCAGSLWCDGDDHHEYCPIAMAASVRGGGAGGTK